MQPFMPTPVQQYDPEEGLELQRLQDRLDNLLEKELDAADPKVAERIARRIAETREDIAKHKQDKRASQREQLAAHTAQKLSHDFTVTINSSRCGQISHHPLPLLPYGQRQQQQQQQQHDDTMQYQEEDQQQQQQQQQGFGRTHTDFCSDSSAYDDGARSASRYGPDDTSFATGSGGCEYGSDDADDDESIAASHAVPGEAPTEERPPSLRHGMQKTTPASTSGSAQVVVEEGGLSSSPNIGIDSAFGPVGFDEESISSSEAGSSSITAPSAWMPENGELVKIDAPVIKGRRVNRYCGRVGKFKQKGGGWFCVKDLDGTDEFVNFRNSELNHIKPAKNSPKIDSIPDESETSVGYLQEEGSVSPAVARAAVAMAAVPSPVELPAGTPEADVRAAHANFNRVQDQFKRFREDEDIVVIRLPTAQDKKTGTAAGCAMISGLAICHSLQQDGPISIATIQSIIDSEAGPPLAVLRGDWRSTDYLPFETAVEKLYELRGMEPYGDILGGSILDDGHFASLMSHLEVDGRVLGCFYLLGHYVFFAKCPVGSTEENSIWSKTQEYVYDLVESLPTIDHCFGYRMRSYNLEAFKVALKNYALERLYASDSSFGLTKGPWLEGRPNLEDPRNFQGWIWPKPETSHT